MKLQNGRVDTYICYFTRKGECSRQKVTERKVPPGLGKLIIYFFYDELVAQVQHGEQIIETISEPFNCSERHFFRGKILDYTQKRKERLNEGLDMFIPPNWEEELDARIILFLYVCRNCTQKHRIYLPFLSGDVLHTVHV